MARQKKRFRLVVSGGAELQNAIRRAGTDASLALPIAVADGAGAVAKLSGQQAPGPHIVIEASKPFNAMSVAYDIGPDRDHWYYQFFETGVQGFEVNAIKRRAVRASGRARNLKEPGPRALAFAGQLFSVVKRGPMPARPFLRNTLIGNSEQIAAFIGAAIKRALNQIGGGTE